MAQKGRDPAAPFFMPKNDDPEKYMNDMQRLGMILPKRYSDASHPQNACGHPDGRPPTVLSLL